MNIVTDVILPLALAFIMFVLGLGLTGTNFLRVIKQPRDFFVGAFSQIILLPIIAFILVKIWPIAPELAIGVMIIAAAPGGVTSNLLTSFARGDVALSISLTAIISLLCVITEVTVKILKRPQTVKAALIGFSTIEDGGNCVSDIIASGIIPAGMEMMDKALIHATDNFVKAGYPRDAESMLIVELDGTETEVEELIKKVSQIAKKNKSSSIKISKNEKQRLKFWAGRKAAFPACGDMAPDYYCMDGTIPRGKLANVLKEIGRLSKKYNLPVANAFHAGDGNLHPLIMYDANEKDSLEKTEKFGADILKYCVKIGGVLTGEHGVGVEKRELMCEMFNDSDIQQQIKIKKALDVSSLLNPGKVYPILRKCAEEGRVHVHRGKTKFPDIPRF